MKKKICVFYNPEAGKRDQEKEIQKLIQELEEQEIEVEIQNVLKIGNLQAFVDKTLEEYQVIGIAGGDGTLREFLGSIVELRHHNIKLLVIPMGTGNDFVRNFAFSQSSPAVRINEMFEKIKNNSTSELPQENRRLFLGRCNHEIFASVSSTGIDAEITASSNKEKPKRATSYLLTAVATLFKYRSKEYQIKYTIDGEEKSIKGKFLLIAMGNTKYYGRGMNIVPNADARHKRLGICLINAMSPFRLIFKIPTLFKGTHINLSYVHNFYADEVHIMSKDEEMLINLDGDVKTMPSAHYQKIEVDHIEIF